MDTSRYRIEYNGADVYDDLIFTIYPPAIAGINSIPFMATISSADIRSIIHDANDGGTVYVRQP